MILTFVNNTARSVDDTLADLGACRQLRHADRAKLREVVETVFGDARIEHLGYVRLEAVFSVAILEWGYLCDICGDVVDVDEDSMRKAATRALSNLDGYVKLMCCYACSKRFAAFCQRTFDREARAVFTPELEQMMLAFLANEVSRLCRKVTKGQPTETPTEAAARRKTNEAPHLQRMVS